MNWSKAAIVIDPLVRKLCYRPYPNHKKGCPNYGKKVGCPPEAPIINGILDVNQPIWAIWNIFDFAGHCKNMQNKHPGWSKRQTECCLYWQPKARKQLRTIIKDFLIGHRGLIIVQCPEACGVDLTATMQSIGHQLEWPPKIKTYQIVLAGNINA